LHENNTRLGVYNLAEGDPVFYHFFINVTNTKVENKHHSRTRYVHGAVLKSKSNYLIVRPKVVQRAGQLSLPHVGILFKI